MSAYHEYANVPFKDKAALIEALCEIRTRHGLAGSWTVGRDILVSEEAATLYDYCGKKRPQTAEIVIPGKARPGATRNSVGDAANDIGFKLNADGSYTPIISEYDHGYYSNDWMNELKAIYVEKVVTVQAKKKGYKVTKTKTADSVKLSLVKWS